MLRGKEGEDYVTCRGCGARFLIIHPSHLEYCLEISMHIYRQRFPEAPLRAKVVSKKQSRTLKARFQTPEGEVTKKQISEASKRMQAGPYGKRASDHLRRLNNTSEQREFLRQQTKERWEEGGDLREKVPKWHQDNRELSLEMAKHARCHITKHFSKPHQQVKEAFEEHGLHSETEFEIGYYSIDEAFPESKVAIECDGCYYHGCETCGFEGIPEVIATDNRKTSYLENRGWTIIRIPSHDIPENLPKYLDEIADHLSE